MQNGKRLRALQPPMPQLCRECWFVFPPTEAKDENNNLMNDVKKLSKKVHAGLKRTQSNTYHTCTLNT